MPSHQNFFQVAIGKKVLVNIFMKGCSEVPGCELISDGGRRQMEDNWRGWSALIGSWRHRAGVEDNLSLEICYAIDL
ncbi:MAG: hypothetical protein LBR80_17545 [Deltaproteobacteria bacterium]|jgi:hypothetical protein|nr:hypothetical protein [Deltaproteobacteria bacterium]